MTRLIRLYDIAAGKQFGSFKDPGLFGNADCTRWSMTQSIVAERFECSPDDVGCLDTEDYTDLITVKGVPVAAYEPGVVIETAYAMAAE